MIMIDGPMVVSVKRSKSLAMNGRGRGGVNRGLERHDVEVEEDGFTADMFLWQAAEAGGCGNGVVLYVPAPSRKNLLILQ
jgi:hypothetical protein